MGIAVLVAGVVVVFVRRRRGASWGAPLALAGVGALGVIPPLTPALGARGLPRVHPAPEPHEGALIDVRSKSRDAKMISEPTRRAFNVLWVRWWLAVLDG